MLSPVRRKRRSIQPVRHRSKKKCNDKTVDGTYIPSLHAHTGMGSLADAYGTVEQWIEALKKRGIKHHFVTDHGTLTAIPQFYKAGQEAGIEIHPGYEGYVIEDYDGHRDEDGKVVRYPFRHVVLLPFNEVGWKNLIKINNEAWRNGQFRKRGRFSYETLFKYNEGLFCLSACMGGIFAWPFLQVFIGKSDEDIEDVRDETMALARRFKKVFSDRLYIELMVNHYEFQREINGELVKIMRKLKIEPVLTNDCHYPEAEHQYYREVIRDFAYKSSSSDVSRDSDADNVGKVVTEFSDLHVRSLEEMLETWKELEFRTTTPAKMLKRAIDNVHDITRRCKFQLDTSLKLPSFDVWSHPVWKEEIAKPWLKKHEDDAELLFLLLIKRGYEAKTGKKWSQEVWAHLVAGKKSKKANEYMRRIAFEFKVIKDAGFIDYFLIVEDIIRYCEVTRGRLYGKGRGSVAGSVISWCLGITRDDPVAYGLFFERFMNPGRVKGELPDIDMDFPSGIRDDVKRYIAKKYGTDKVTSIGNVGVIKIKSAVQKLAAAQDFVIDGEEYDFHSLQKITRSIPQGIGGGVMIETLDDAVSICSKDENNKFFKFYQKHKGWLEEHYPKVDKHPITYGRHAAGVVVSPKPIDDCIPIRINTVDGQPMVVAQWRDKDLLSQGFLKLDILGLNTLDQIEFARHIIYKRHHVATPELGDEDRDDPRVHAMIKNGATMGVFQLNSHLFRTFFKHLKPREFKHIYTTTALLRPGPLKVNAHTRYAEIEHGIEDPKYIHDAMIPALRETGGLVIFQEQAMQLCVDIAGFTLEEADTFRSVVGKKKLDKMPAQKKKFIKGAIAKGFDESVAISIFKEIEAFAGYGFNKSHAVSYSGLSIYQAWLKRHFPREYWASKLQFGSDDQEKKENVWVYRTTMMAEGIKMMPVSVNTCSDVIKIGKKSNKIYWRLDLIKGVGQAAAYVIGKSRPFTGPVDLLVKCATKYKEIKGKDPSRVPKRNPVTKRVIVALLNAGAFDDCSEKSRFDMAVDYLETRYTKKKWPEIQAYIYQDELDYNALYASEKRPVCVDIQWARAFNSVLNSLALQQQHLRFSDRPYWKIFKEQVPGIKGGVTAGSLAKMKEGTSVYVYGLKNKVIIRKVRSSGREMVVGSISEYDGLIDFLIFPRAFNAYVKDAMRDVIADITSFIWVSGNVMKDDRSGKKKISVTALGKVKW